MRVALFGLLAFFALFAAAAVIRVGEASDLAGGLIIGLFAFWAIVPYLMLAAVGAICVPVRASLIVLMIGALLVAAFGLWSILQVSTSSTGGLILIFAPLWQSVGALVFCVPALLLRMRKS